MKKIKEYGGIYILIPFFLVGITGFFIFKRGEAELILNRYHTGFFDQFFRYCTYLGDGMVFVFLIILLLFYRYYYIILTMFLIILQTVVVQVLKMIVFRDVDRPILFFSHTPGIHFVPGVTMHLYQSFPSGHTTTAFSAATILTIVIKNKKLSALWYGLAALVAFSRVYLLQHFFIDVFSGAFIGIVVALLCWYLLENSPLSKKESLKGSLSGHH